ncbi:MAG TPA: leucyl aminopeptidase [Candidatus Limnocylindrales bacterium]
MQFQTVAAPDGVQLDALIVPVFKDGSAASGTPHADRETAEWVAREQGSPKIFSTSTHLRQRDGGGATRLVVVAAGKREEFDIQRGWEVVSAGVRALWSSTAKTIGVCLETQALPAAEAIQAAVEGVHFAMWRPDTHRTIDDEHPLPPVASVVLITGDAPVDAAAAITTGDAVGEAVNWARSLAIEPANLMTPTHIAAQATELAKSAGLQIEVIEEDQAREMGMNSYLSVAHGSHEDAKFIVLRYQGRGGDGYDLALVGKGITFDSGGISLKPGADMHLMKYDMSGAAAVLASAGAIANLGLKINLIAVAPCTENLPGGHATKPGDVFTSLSGKTVEVINTDAEGRLVLIDGVTYAQRQGAARIVDVATLTGAIAVALGRHYAGVFGRPDGFVESIRRAGALSGERMWPMPLSDEYRDDIRSEIADIKNSAGREGGAMFGAAFVEAGVDPEIEWAHIDIAGVAWYDSDRTFAPKGPQGSAVRTLVELASSIASRQR